MDFMDFMYLMDPQPSNSRRGSFAAGRLNSRAAHELCSNPPSIHLQSRDVVHEGSWRGSEEEWDAGTSFTLSTTSEAKDHPNRRVPRMWFR